MAEEDVYCTLLLNDQYLPGVQVLAHSLRDAGTAKRLAVMVTLDTVSQDTVAELKKLYDYVIPVDPIYNRSPANLYLMNRIDLSAAFTKVNIWKQTQFRRVVYVDADILALRAPDELFDITAPFAAAPDIGWPDCFNSGVMVLKPDMDTYNSLTGLAAGGNSFDGADQGLLNQHFKDWHRISFNYNVTPSASYQYVPAYRYYGANASMVHFIGAEKPWSRGGRSGPGGPYNELSGKWQDVYNKYYGAGTQRTGYGQGYSVTVPKLGYTASQPSISRTTKVGGSLGGAQDAAIEIWPNPVQSVVVQEQSAQSAGEVSAGQPEEKFVPIRSIALPSHADHGNADRDDAFHEDFVHEDVVHEDATPEDVVREDVVPEDVFPEDAVPKSVVPKDVVLEDVVPEDAVPEDAAPEDSVREDVPEDVFHDELAELNAHPIVTHYQHYALHGWLPAFVMTDKGPVPHEKYFRTGEKTYYIQEDPADQPNDWDPTKTAPPLGSGPEAPNLKIPILKNEWDGPAKRTRQPAPPMPAPIFPWEQRARTTTRVFAEDIPVDDYVSDVSSEEDETERNPSPPPLQEEVEEESWRTYSMENQWDTDPTIRNYVSNLNRRNNPSSRPPPPPPPPAPTAAAPNPTRNINPSWLAGETDAGEQWDPAAKLEELRRLPLSFIQAFMSGALKESGIQAEGEGVAQPNLPDYSDNATQTDDLFAQHQSTQYDSEDDGSVQSSFIRSDVDSEDTWEKDTDASQVSIHDFLPDKYQSERMGRSFSTSTEGSIDLRDFAGIPHNSGADITPKRYRLPVGREVYHV